MIVRVVALVLSIWSHGAAPGESSDRCFPARARAFERYLRAATPGGAPTSPLLVGAVVGAAAMYVVERRRLRRLRARLELEDEGDAYARVIRALDASDVAALDEDDQAVLTGIRWANAERRACLELYGVELYAPGAVLTDEQRVTARHHALVELVDKAAADTAGAQRRNGTRGR